MLCQKFTRSDFDHCVYFKRLKEGIFIYLLLYVDDMLIACSSMVEIDKMKAPLSQEYETKDLDKIKNILRMEISR